SAPSPPAPSIGSLVLSCAPARWHICRMETLQGFDIDTCSVAAGTAGVGLLQYAALDSVDTDSYEPARDAAYIHRRTLSATWHSLPFVIGSGSLSEEQDADTQGDRYRVELSAFLPGDSAGIRLELNRMRQHRFLLRITGR